MVFPMPVADLDLPPEELPIVCAECEETIEDEVCCEDGEYYHTACCEEIEEELCKEAEEFAKTNCKIIRKLHRFDPHKEWACSRDDYEMRVRESYTENSVRAHNRHNCTNYDQLLPQRLDDSMWARALYEAVRERIEELLENASDDQYDSPSIEELPPPSHEE
jgi:hypothetical protein